MQLDVTAPQGVVFLLDVDNTLLDNDHVIADLRGHLERAFGTLSANRYWTIFEGLRSELGYADYLGALQRYRLDIELGQGDDPRLLQMSTYLIDYPFADRLYPRALAVIERLNTFGHTVILSDGDVVFQPRKVQRSGLWEAVSGRVLIYIHSRVARSTGEIMNANARKLRDLGQRLWVDTILRVTPRACG